MADLSATFNNRLGTHIIMESMISNTTSNDSSFYSYFNRFYLLIISSLIASLLPVFTHKFTEFINTVKENINIRKLTRLFKTENTITLSYTATKSYYGRSNANISPSILSVLFYIKKNMNKFKDLYSLVQDETLKKYNFETDLVKHIPLYKINQDSDFLLADENIIEDEDVKIKYKNKTLKAYCYTNKLTDKENKNNTNNRNEITTRYSIDLISDTMTLQEIHEFIDYCSLKYNEHLQKDKNQYIFTYTGTDDDKIPNFRKEKFYSFSDFNSLYGKSFRDIEETFDFFESKKGENWYKERNLPYQLTILLHGIPGTGKSAVAAAIAKKYNLTIIRINISAIKTNTEFINAFKCRTFEEAGKEYQYKNLLYLFDEIDAYSNNVFLDRNIKTESDSNSEVNLENALKIQTGLEECSKMGKHLEMLNKKTMSMYTSQDMKKQLQINKKLLDIFKDKSPRSIEKDTDILCLSTILEEISGINQMYGRKMIMISNYPEKLDKALLRPERTDMIIELSYINKESIVMMLQNFFKEDERIIKNTIDLLKYIPDKEFTPAEISNLCKVHKTLDKLLENL